MSKREFTSVILKLLGIYTIIEALFLLQGLGVLPLLSMIASGSDDIGRGAWLYVAMFVPFGLFVIVAILLLACSGNIARFIIKDDGDVSLPGPLSGREFQAICFSVVGVLVFLLGIPRLSQLFTYLYYLISQYGSGQIVQGQLVTRALQVGISVAIQCGLAIILFFRAKGLVNFWHRIQITRYVKIEEAEPSDLEDRV